VPGDALLTPQPADEPKAAAGAAPKAGEKPKDGAEEAGAELGMY